MVLGTRREKSTSWAGRIGESLFAVAVCTEDIAVKVGQGLDGRLAAGPCLVTEHTADFDNMLLRCVLGAHAFVGHAVVAANLFPALIRPKRSANMHSAGTFAVVPLAGMNPAGCIHSHRAWKGYHLGRPYYSESNIFIIVCPCGWRAGTIGFRV